jgi:hypothetical protein
VCINCVQFAVPSSTLRRPILGVFSAACHVRFFLGLSACFHFNLDFMPNVLEADCLIRKSSSSFSSFLLPLVLRPWVGLDFLVEHVSL